ncbi:Uncharacterised protein [Escherichia coli]|uniref:Uncharacterized protein n=1 Tax=Escherichia coli TaxID=562 RepID=A0A376U7N8_ECOLX|nr:Uncharacterised protein [Escherichia coli]
MLPGVLPWKKPRPDRWLIKPGGQRLPLRLPVCWLMRRCVWLRFRDSGRFAVNGEPSGDWREILSSSAGGQLITRQLPNESRTVNKLWEHLRDNHGIDATHLRFDPVGEYQKMLAGAEGRYLKNELNHAIRRSWLRRIA